MKYLVGTGGWGYFPNPNQPSLKLYSQIYNFVEVNQTFYEFPETKTVQRWHKIAPKNFTFAVRCHQILTHKLALEPVDEAYYILGQMVAYCAILHTPYLLLETPQSFSITKEVANKAKDLFSSWDLKNIQLIWEIRAPITHAALDLMQDLKIIHCTDLSKQKPSFNMDVTYSRLFGKGKHNIYQFTNDELQEIKHNAEETNSKKIILAYHGARMHSDALRFQKYIATGKFPAATANVGVESARTVLSEDTHFPISQMELVQKQGWKVIDTKDNKTIHLSEVLSQIPNKEYSSVEEVVSALEAIL